MIGYRHHWYWLFTKSSNFGIVPTSMDSHWLGTKGPRPSTPSLRVPLNWAKSLRSNVVCSLSLSQDGE
jgi:hypothetical protein